MINEGKTPTFEQAETLWRSTQHFSPDDDAAEPLHETCPVIHFSPPVLDK